MTHNTQNVDVFSPYALGPLRLPNRLVMAPMTRNRAGPGEVPGPLAVAYYTQRASAGLIVTEGTQISQQGQGYPGTPGIFTAEQIAGWKRVTESVHAAGGRIFLQLWHVGRISHPSLQPSGGLPVAPSALQPPGQTMTAQGMQPFVMPRALETHEIAGVVDDYRRGAANAKAAGFDGVELHGAHGYLLCQFLSPTINQRTDRYGGSLENRARVIFEIIQGVRERCRPDFSLGLRLSPERFDLRLTEICELAQRLMDEGRIDYLDMSLWDVRKEPEEEAFKGRSLMSYFTDLKRGQVRLGVAGKVMAPQVAIDCLEAGCDFVLLGRAAILHHDYPLRLRADPDFRPVSLPVTREYLSAEGLGPAFVDYMNGWRGFVAQTEPA
jgi:2,4-dienoyl-CoA reductase-like NADH-dependent reductase (Old Yellow Enzyme family)